MGATLAVLTPFQSAQASVLFESTPFETLIVDSTTPTLQVFSSVLSNGIHYKVEVSGIYTPDFRFGQRNENWDVDARFVSRDLFTTFNDEDPAFGNFDFGLFSSALGSDNDDFWGNYQSSHIYSHEFLGTGSSIDFYVNDVGLASGADNAGVFTVQIFREAAIPEPLTLLGAGTALGFGTFFKRKLARNS